MSTIKTNATKPVATVAVSAVDPAEDACYCGHTGAHHGTGNGAVCRFTTSCGCTNFRAKDV